MTKSEMITKVSEVVDMTKKDVNSVLEAFTDVVIDTLKNDKDEKVTLPGLGTFKVKSVPERKGVATLGGGKSWVKPAHDEICFKLIKSIREI